jgi:hypothetical protein
METPGQGKTGADGELNTVSARTSTYSELVKYMRREADFHHLRAAGQRFSHGRRIGALSQPPATCL